MSIRVVVVGAGLGGLALAQGLSRQGIDVVVYERDAAATARRQGDRVLLGPSGLTGLRRCLPQDLHDLCLATAGLPLAPPRMLDEKLNPTAENAYLPQQYTPWTQTYAVHRATLREILLTGVNVRYGKEFSNFEPIGDRVRARFVDGHEDVADLLVGADGVGSAVRRQLLPHAEVGDAGLRLIYGRIPLHHRNALPAWVFERVFTVVGGPGAHVGVGPVILRNRPTGRLTPVDDYVACMVGAPADRLPAELRGLDGPELHRLATSLIGQDWHRDLRCLLDRWDTESLFPLRIASAAAVENWSTPGVTLLGDAVHAMSPTLAMGANTALRDGGELSYAIATSGTLREAATVYQARMLSYAMPLVQESRRIGRSRIGQR